MLAMLLALMTLAAAAFVPTAGADSGCTPGTLTLPSGALYPNGIARAADGTLYVGLVTSGQILRKPPHEAWQTLFKGSDTVFASTTLRLDERRGLLWGNSPDFLPTGKSRAHRIFALDIATATVTRNLVLPAGTMGNDIVLAPDGTVYLTETKVGSILRLGPDDRDFQWVLRDARLAGPGGLGASGIVREEDGTLMVANFGTGKIYILGNAQQVPRLREMELPRTLENPDGMGLAPDGSLIVLENAIQSGQGKVLRIAEPLAPGRRVIEVIREGLESPVNLTITAQGCAFVSEARIRHRLLAGHEAEVPERFQIHEIPLGIR
ncbi:hypothetical protein [Pseudomonas chlororaphis]|uniref:Gluconolaconase n=1 Tax=Pseudomonas chlororaphis TaxID=587753 RepID=A0A1Q8ENN5_9PSED|nr:hypothetical protein [Pseudomonas chlororaphis]OLF53391.1 hypothetical protein BTN82_16635 [Pseudomonas chlororaphis]